MRRALFGGSFDPFHLGHFGLVEVLLTERIVDHVTIMPCKQSPHKLDRLPAADHHRLRMIELSLRGVSFRSQVEVSEYELRKEGVSYTSETLRELQSSHPEDEWSLVIGADQWLSFDRWHECSYIREHFGVIVFGRDAHEAVVGEGLVFVPYQRDVSSTKIRLGERSKASLTPSVIGYIRECNLYEQS